MKKRDAAFYLEAFVIVLIFLIISLLAFASIIPIKDTRGTQVITLQHANTQTANRFEVQDSKGNVDGEWRYDGTVWLHGKKIGKAETMLEFFAMVGI